MRFYMKSYKSEIKKKKNRKIRRFFCNFLDFELNDELKNWCCPKAFCSPCLVPSKKIPMPVTGWEKIKINRLLWDKMSPKRNKTIKWQRKLLKFTIDPQRLCLIFPLTLGISRAFRITLFHVRSIDLYFLLSTGSCFVISSLVKIGSKYIHCLNDAKENQ